MNKILVIFFLLINLVAVAQKRFSEGSIRYDVSIKSLQGGTATSAGFLQMIKGSHYRSEFSSNLGKTTTIFDLRDRSGCLLREYGTQKIMIPMNGDQWDEKIEPYLNQQFSLLEETKAIIGFNCQMAKAEMGDSSSMIVFFTREILPETVGMELQFSGIPGMVLEYISVKKNIEVTYTARSIDFEPVPIQKFERPKSGYRILEFEKGEK